MVANWSTVTAPSGISANKTRKFEFAAASNKIQCCFKIGSFGDTAHNTFDDSTCLLLEVLIKFSFAVLSLKTEKSKAILPLSFFFSKKIMKLL